MLAEDATVAAPDASSGAAAAAPTVFANRYEVRTLLGHGGMGAVFRVHDRELCSRTSRSRCSPAATRASSIGSAAR